MTRDQSGIEWRFAPTWPVGVAAPCLDARAKAVKLASHRDVFRLHWHGMDLHLKHYRPDGREILRALVRPRKAQSEFRLGLELLRRGVPTLEPLAWGKRGMHSFLVTRTLPEALPLPEWLEANPARRGYMMRTLGAFLARAHDAGVRHGDLHPGNLLATPRGTLHLIDLAMASAGTPLSWAESRSQLLMIDRWFALRLSRADRLRAWKAYVAGRSVEVDPHHDARRLANDTEKSLRTLAVEMDDRCQGKGRHFRRTSGGVAVASVDRAALESLKARADWIIESSPALKKSGSSAIVETTLMVDGEERPVILKRMDATRWTDPLASLFRDAPAFRAWRMGHALYLRGLATPRPLAVWHQRKWGLATTGYLVMERVPQARNLLEYLRSESNKRAVLHELGRLLRRLHGWHLSHRDLKAANILVSPARAVMGERGLQCEAADGSAHVWLCDLAGVRHCPGMPETRRVRDLARLAASFFDEPGITRTDRLCFLGSYLNAGLRGWRGWKSWWERIELAAKAKRETNMRRGRVLG